VWTVWGDCVWGKGVSETVQSLQTNPMSLVHIVRVSQIMYMYELIMIMCKLSSPPAILANTLRQSV